MENLETKIRELFKGQASRFILQDELGLIEGLLIRRDNTAFLIINFFNGILDEKTLRKIDRTKMKSMALNDVMRKKSFHVVYEYAFSDLAENFWKHEEGTVDWVCSFMNWIKEESSFMKELGFETTGYGTYKYQGLVFRRHQEMRFIIEQGNRGYGLWKADGEASLDRQSIWGNIRIPLKLFADHSQDTFMSLPSKARDWALRRKKETGYRLIEEQYGKS